MPSERYLQLRKEHVKDLHNNDLLKACQEDEDLLADLIKENKDFIYAVISYYKGDLDALKKRFNVTMDDLLQHAYIGIITALNNFDFSKGVKFTTYSHRAIIWEINKYLYSDSKTVKLSRNALNIIKKMEQLENDLGKRPPLEEVSKALEIPIERLEEVLRFANDLLYIEAINAFEVEAPNANYESGVTNKIYMDDMLGSYHLDDFELKVAELIMDGYTNAEIARDLNTYPMTINRAIKRIRGKITNSFNDKRTSKYEKEIDIISEDMIERNCYMNIWDIKELLDVCGFDINNYSTRILYYIRQKSIKRIPYSLNECK